MKFPKFTGTFLRFLGTTLLVNSRARSEPKKVLSLEFSFTVSPEFFSDQRASKLSAEYKLLSLKLPNFYRSLVSKFGTGFVLNTSAENISRKA